MHQAMDGDTMMSPEGGEAALLVEWIMSRGVGIQVKGKKQPEAAAPSTSQRCFVTYKTPLLK